MIRLHVHPGTPAAGIVGEVKTLAVLHPGDHRLELVVGERRLELGPEWTYDDSRELTAELEDFGRVEVLPS